ncbi:MAG: hypothetical protein QW578_06930 [Thermoplasmatales archaeon]
MRKVVNVELEGTKRKAVIDTDRDECIYWTTGTIPKVELHVHYITEKKEIKKEIYYLYLHSNSKLFKEKARIDLLSRDEAIDFLLQIWPVKLTLNDVILFGFDKYFPDIEKKILERDQKLIKGD